MINVNSSISIRPSRDLRNNYAQVSTLCRENPVAITVNGREDTVIADHTWFMNQQKYISELEERLAVYTRLSQAADDVRLGRVYPEDEVFEDVLKVIGDF